MYLVHINPVVQRPCHDHSSCATPADREACTQPKQMLLFSDGSYAYIHSGQSADREHVRYQSQSATSETRHLFDRCYRKVVRCEFFESFGMSLDDSGVESVPQGLRQAKQDLEEEFVEISLQAEREAEVNLWEEGEKVSSPDAEWEMV